MQRYSRVQNVVPGAFSTCRTTPINCLNCVRMYDAQFGGSWKHQPESADILTCGIPTYTDEVTIPLMQLLDFLIKLIIFGGKIGVMNTGYPTPEWTGEVLETVKVKTVNDHTGCNS